MARKKKDEGIGLVKPVLALTGGAVILGTGAQVVGGVGGPVAASAGAGLTAAAGFLPPLGVVIGGGVVVNQLRNLEKQTKQKRR